MSTDATSLPVAAAAPERRVQRVAFRRDSRPIVVRLIGLIRAAEGSTDRRTIWDRETWVDMLYRLRRESDATLAIRLCNSCPRPFYIKIAGQVSCERCTRAPR